MPNTKNRKKLAFRPSVESLEPRLALAAAAVVNAGPLSNVITMRSVPLQEGVEVSIDGVLTNTFLFRDLSSLTINGQGGNDELVLDNLPREPFPLRGFSFNGGDGADHMVFSNGGFAAINHSVTTASNGRLSITDTLQCIKTCFEFTFETRVMDYSNVEALVLAPNAVTNLSFNLPAGPNLNVTVGDEPAAVTNYSQLRGPTVGEIYFRNPDNLTVNLGNGGDSISFVTPDPTFNSTTNVTVNGGNRNDVIVGPSPATQKIWTLNGGGGNDILIGGSGNDRLNGGPGNDTMTGGPGNDYYRLDADQDPQTDTVNEKVGGGTDTLDFSSTEFRSVSVDLGKAALQAIHPAMSLALTAGANVENAAGGALDDLLIGNALHNMLQGGLGNDRIIGLAGNDKLVGEKGNDTYIFDTDLALGGDSIEEHEDGGIDTLDFSPTTTRAVAINLGNAAAQVVNAGMTILLGSNTALENVVGGSKADTITGNSANNTLTGNGGNDTLAGGSGNDFYRFDADEFLGTDTVNEAVNGGKDTLDFSTTTTRGVSVNLGDTNLQVVNDGHLLRLGSNSSIENVIGSSQADILTGNALDNALTGGMGNDSLTGGPGNDTYLFATALNDLGTDALNEVTGGGIDTLDFSAMTDRLVAVDLSYAALQTSAFGAIAIDLSSGITFENVIGTNFADSITGNGLANMLTGGGGADSLIGGPGDDTYVFDVDSDFDLQILDESGGGFDTLDFHLTSSVALTVDVSQANVQFVSDRFGLLLNSGGTFEKVIGGKRGDVIIGNALDNILIGGPGDDLLRGGLGRDLIISNGGNFGTVLGDGGDDLLILGSTVYDTQPTALRTILSEWTNSTKSYATRVTNLRNGINDVALRAPAVSRDSLRYAVAVGGSGSDWYFATLDDVLADVASGELIDAIS